ncbi:hypothetical protein CONCODRAFT_9169 [Conidiobolus coronatus NRRL 28638]|uniref:Uncharacterized protein n=1 Tax=Conidiobolus coronatus (strain ATCC 28846 / CBS 209.66 / NRRL 28638) TaxID=796925 RepID=A0A137P0H1_CONC2|nr:hypothetical protein CONCODRAFT_9169 [Conidiobolus coronatus NRRL 28638]|eukprot:KXN68573.1 hypothetical protein CONCODRAFT_9169 [Conidiobolus coronatus NRRL 28638]
MNIEKLTGKFLTTQCDVNPPRCVELEHLFEENKDLQMYLIVQQLIQNEQLKRNPADQYLVQYYSKLIELVNKIRPKRESKAKLNELKLYLYFHLALIHQNSNQFIESESYYSHCLKIKKNSLPVINNLAVLWHHRGNLTMSYILCKRLTSDCLLSTSKDAKN